ncbi:putative salicylate hydroxylase [Triangularia setosa]|uniref:Salicylate hydroxylase n=1 Tax=Triangularia setosa TaxID=2587417 RepID=A0AAN6W4Q1_9PEZI|nr:putative salicylate hydroxylase [Podospora setosa]
MSLHIIIVGAGIAGLSAAVSIRRAGHIVEIYERTLANNEAGAAITVPPNASRFLIGWGLDPAAERFVKADELTFVDPLTLKTLFAVPQTQNRIRYGHDLWFSHRVDLHSWLKRKATEPVGPGNPVTLHLKSAVVGYNPTTPSITLADGTVLSADLVIGADGVHSLATEVVLGQKVELSPSAHYNTCYRFLIPASWLAEDPETKWWDDAEHADKVSMRIITHNATSRRIVSYPCRNREIHNFVGLYYDPTMETATREDYLAKVDKESVLETFGADAFNPQLRAVIGKATEVKRWPLLNRRPISTWHRGRLVLAGDAAHPILPHQGQGGAQGLEDGCVLGIVLHGASTPAEIENRLEIYEKVRRNRASAIQILSSVGMDQGHLVLNNLEPYFPEGQIPKTPPEMMEFASGYDIVAASTKAMKELDPGFELLADFFESK